MSSEEDFLCEEIGCATGDKTVLLDIGQTIELFCENLKKNYMGLSTFTLLFMAFFYNRRT